MQRIDQFAPSLLVNLQDVALEAHIHQEVSGRQREIIRYQFDNLDDRRFDDKRTVDMDGVGNEQRANQ